MYDHILKGVWSSAVGLHHRGQDHFHKRCRRHDHCSIDAMIVEERQPGDTEPRLENIVLQERRAYGSTQEGMSRGTVDSRLWERHRAADTIHPLGPIPLTLERIRWQCDMVTRIVLIKTCPVHICSMNIKPGETVEHLLPIIPTFAQ